MARHFSFNPVFGAISRAFSGVIGVYKRLNKFLGFYLGHFFERSKKSRYRLVIAVLAIYILLGFIGAIPVYGFKIDSQLTRGFERLFPYPAAIVNGGIVTLRSLHKQEDFVLQFADRTGQQIDQNPREKVLDQLIENKIVSKTAAKQGFHISQKDVDSAYEKVLVENGGKKEVEKVLRNLYDMSLSDFKGLVRAQVLKDKIREDLLVRVKARHILVKDEGRARDVLERVKKGENWDELAKQFSEDTASRDQGGDLGFNNRGVLAKPFEDAAFALQPGQTHQELVKTDFGNHIVRVDERNQGKIDKSYDDFLKEQKEKTRIIKLVK